MTSLNSHGIRFAFGTLTVLPVRVTRWDRGAARAGMLCAPLAGLVVGLLSAAAGGLLLLLGSAPLLAAVASAAVPAALTRGLHLDGLADTADGLGSGKPADDALRIMKQSDIGPFGVITLLFVLLAQVAALAELYGRGWAYGAVAVGTVVVAGCAGAGALLGGYGAPRHALAAVAALGVAQLLLRHCVRRFGGVTGDVFGALAETAATAALVALTFG
ncbi:adenosylcobinamide-GDP ribazoletransferase [Streptomyces sp. CLV115]|uniref:adenosylcobinamide-GDP ribazoletransferase n=1 Tax=Streptomyces sp. CLV115 TaxID=3138502 RepID=UPI00313EB7DC